MAENEAAVHTKLHQAAGKVLEERVSVEKLNDTLSRSASWRHIDLAGSNASTGPVEIDPNWLKGRTVKLGYLGISSSVGSHWDVVFAPESAGLEVEFLSVSWLKTRTLDRLMKSFGSVKRISLRNISEIPPSIYKKDLEILSLSGQSISQIPEGIARSAYLGSLTISETRCRSLPHDLSELKRLENAYLWGNLLESCPPLPSAKDIVLIDNRIRTIPDWIAETLPKKKLNYPQIVIYLRGNPIAHSEDIVNAQPRFSADAWDLEPDMEQIRHKVKRYKHGREIDLSRNYISRLPPWMANESVKCVCHQIRGTEMNPAYATGSSRVYRLAN